MSIKGKMSRSAQLFSSVVWPEIKGWCGGGRIIPVESITESEFAGLLDVYAGVDAWHVEDERKRVRGIASRVQDGSAHPYASFTIRTQTRNGNLSELQKRTEAIDKGWLYPALTVQAYVDDEGLVGVGIIHTAQLIAYAARLRRESVRNNQDGARFLPIWWSELQRSGVPMRCKGAERLSDAPRASPGQLTLEEAILNPYHAEQIRKSVDGEWIA